MTDEKLDALEALLAKATPGPWREGGELSADIIASNHRSVAYDGGICVGHDAAAIVAAVNFLRAELPAIRELRAEVGGWIVGNNAGGKWVAWSSDGWAVWVEDPAKATRYARRCDAETIHGDDDSAWRVVRFADAALNPKGDAA